MDKDILDAASKLTAEVHVHLPERMPGEPDASEGQLGEIASLGKAESPSDEVRLGTWQAAYVIQRLREERAALEARALAAAQQVQARRNANGWAWALIILLFLVFFVW